MNPLDETHMGYLVVKKVRDLLEIMELSREDLDNNPDIALDIALIAETMVSINRRVAERKLSSPPEDILMRVNATGRTMTLVKGGKDESNPS